MRTTITLLVLPLPLLLLGGCPQTGGTALQAVISVSSSFGDAPLTVTFMATDSIAPSGSTLTYAWTFGDGGTGSGATVAHTFNNPGLYTVELTITDQNGSASSAEQDIRVRGSGATAVISADSTAGNAPHYVRFDGSGSSAPDDTIRDYFWDFGDGSTSTLVAPHHEFKTPGTFTVALTVTTAGGVTDTASIQIVVGTAKASLQFNGTSLARLPLASELTARQFGQFTLELWFNADTDGGQVVSIGSAAATLALDPPGNTVQFTVSGNSSTGIATNLSGQWQHIALVYDGDAAGRATLYYNGAELAYVTVSGTLTTDRLTLGNGYQGKLAEVRFWNTVRTGAELLATMSTRLSGTESDLFGYWRLDEGSGQTLRNRGAEAFDGTLGHSTGEESADPAWSTDGPDL